MSRSPLRRAAATRGLRRLRRLRLRRLSRLSRLSRLLPCQVLAPGPYRMFYRPARAVASRQSTILRGCAGHQAALGTARPSPQGLRSHRGNAPPLGQPA